MRFMASLPSERCLAKTVLRQHVRRHCRSPAAYALTTTRGAVVRTRSQQDRGDPNNRIPALCRYQVRRLLSSWSPRNEAGNSTNGSFTLDFFGQPVSRLDNDSLALQHDNFLLAILTRGKSTVGGGNSEGLPIQAAHSMAQCWEELLSSTLLSTNESSSPPPMLVVALVAPILVQANTSYLKTLDSLLQQCSNHPKNVSLYEMAETASQTSTENLTSREELHLQAIKHLLKHERSQAISVYLKLLTLCPGDALALALCIELALSEGKRAAALKAATWVFAYWQERSREAGHAIGASWLALGLAAGGRFAAAEGLVQATSPIIDLEGSHAVSQWALAHVYDAEGRVAEGITALKSYDGGKKFELAGWLFFDSHLSGYGGRVALDREGSGDGRSILRIYDNAYDRVLMYSGYSTPGKPITARRAPTSQTRQALESAGTTLTSWFSFSSSTSDQEGSIEAKSAQSAGESIAMVDVLTWLPPTPRLLTDATFLLLRLTLHGSINGSDHRWCNLKNAWNSHLATIKVSELPQSLFPLARIAVSLVCHEDHSLVGDGSPASLGASLFGQLLQLGVTTPLEEIGTAEEWKQVVLHLAEDDSSSNCWEVDGRPLWEVGLCYAASKSQDVEALSIARSVCSRGVALRPNSPEEWWRYSTILTLMGDHVAAEEARAASVSMGAGEGGYGAH